MTQTGPVVAVRGEIIREVPPEIAIVSVTVSARDRERPEALARLTARVEALRALLDRYADAIERRETGGLYVYPETRGAGERVVGYRGSLTTELRVVDFAVLGELMLAVGDLDQTAVYGPQWSLRPDSPAYRRARHDAIGDALVRAREYAEALGSRLTGLVELADSGLSRGGAARDQQVFRGEMAVAAGAAPAFDLEPRPQEVYASVEARFAITEPPNL
jgi:uncharacterized protein